MNQSSRGLWNKRFDVFQPIFIRKVTGFVTEKAVERESVVNRMTGVRRQVGVVMVIPVEGY